MGRFDYAKEFRLKRNIVYVQVPAKTSMTIIQPQVSGDDHLKRAIREKAEELKKQGIQILDRAKNVILTPEHYILAVYEDVINQDQQ